MIKVYWLCHSAFYTMLTMMLLGFTAIFLRILWRSGSILDHMITHLHIMVEVSQWFRLCVNLRQSLWGVWLTLASYWPNSYWQTTLLVHSSCHYLCNYSSTLSSSLLLSLPPPHFPPQDASHFPLSSSPSLSGKPDCLAMVCMGTAFFPEPSVQAWLPSNCKNS